MRFLLVVVTCGFAQAQEIRQSALHDDDAALALADSTRTEASARRACIEYAEAAGFDTTYSDATPASPGGRASFSFRCDAALASGWRGVVSDRFDEIAARGSAAQAVNTLKEAYVSFRAGSGVLVDVGRVNVREGVAFAYN